MMAMRVYLIVLLILTVNDDLFSMIAKGISYRANGRMEVSASATLKLPNQSTIITWGFCRDPHLPVEIPLEEISWSSLSFENRLIEKEMRLYRNFSSYCGSIRDSKTRHTKAMIAFRGFDFRKVWGFAEMFSRFLCTEKTYCQLDTLQALTKFIVHQVRWIEDDGINLVTDNVAVELWNTPHPPPSEYPFETFHPNILSYDPSPILEGVWDFVYEILQEKAIQQSRLFQQAVWEDDQVAIASYQYDYVTKRVIPLDEIFPFMMISTTTLSDQGSESADVPEGNNTTKTVEIEQQKDDKKQKQSEEKKNKRNPIYKLLVVLTPTSIVRRKILDESHPDYLPYRPSPTMLATIAKEILGILRVMDVDIAYGYGLLYEHQQEFADDCTFVRNYFHSLTILTTMNEDQILNVHCVGSIVNKPSTSNIYNSDNDPIGSGAYFPDYHFDARGHILSQLSEPDEGMDATTTIIAKADYFIFLDIDKQSDHLYQNYFEFYRLSHIYDKALSSSSEAIDRYIEEGLPYYKGGWMVNSIKNLLFGGILKKFGITFLHCTGKTKSTSRWVENGDGNSSSQNKKSDPEYHNTHKKSNGKIGYTAFDNQILHNLKNIAIHRTTLFYLQQRSHISEPVIMSVFQHDVAKEFNNFRLYEMFKMLDSLFCLDQELVAIPTYRGTLMPLTSFQVSPLDGRNRGEKLIPIHFHHEDVSVFANNHLSEKWINIDGYEPLYTHKHLLALVDTLYLKAMPSIRASSLQFQRMRALAMHNMKCEEIYKIKSNAKVQIMEAEKQQEVSQQLDEMLSFLDMNHWLERRICTDQHIFQAEKLVPDQEFIVTGPRVAVITAIYGDKGYEKTLKRFAMQTVSTDFICFTDSPHLTSTVDHQGKANHHGWIIDRTPYHLQSLQEDIDLNQTHFQNSLFRNRHPFNIAKFYKTSFHKIPRIRDAEYDIVIWIDGTIRITDHEMSAKILSIFEKRPEETMVVFEHSRKGGKLEVEVDASKMVPKYIHTQWLGVDQPFQDLVGQYEDYRSFGYSDEYWEPFKFQYLLEVNGVRKLRPRPEYGVWCTCFIAFKMKSTIDSDADLISPYRIDKKTELFLQTWYSHIKKYTTQDQISFPFVSQKLHIHPFSLPSEEDGIYGNLDFNSLYIKLEHGQ